MVVEAEAYQAQVRRILQSKAFRTSEVHRNLLTYLSEKSLSGDADSLKEYTVGLDVFQKPDSYDPRQESVVRMHMARLRQKLGEYYRTEGLEDPIIVDLPKGAFKVTFDTRPVVLEPEPPLERVAPPVVSLTSKRTFMLLAGLLIAAIACATYFGVRLSQTQKKESFSLPTTWTPELRELWAPLLSADRPLVVCLATQEASNLTGLATANGAFRLGQFLADRKQNVYMTGSDELSMPEISMGNVVFLGPMTASRQLKALPVHEELTLEASGIHNLHPAKGEPEFFSDPKGKTGDIQESFALITHAPGVNAKGDVLYLSGNHSSSVSAGVEAFTDPLLAGKMVQGMRKSDGKLPRYYQVVLKVRSMDDTPLEIDFVLSKELMAAPR